jgi:hypothetical protein
MDLQATGNSAQSDNTNILESSVSRINSLAAKFAAKASFNKQQHSNLQQQTHISHFIPTGGTKRTMGSAVELLQTNDPTTPDTNPDRPPSKQSSVRSSAAPFAEGALCGSQMPGSLKGDESLDF